ncbi:SCO family protein [Azoarcus sp. KH32C]|uniref:SCO family protein n=1 Tax=Azoarcus sp. KH32C TaxID=748247 RepID=UPI000238699F|nr:SCO family protein [Azoarcus sp. KH32C]BAL25915.1 SCO1/SenC family protein [Azoarcus sp. KH32C]
MFRFLLAVVCAFALAACSEHNGPAATTFRNSDITGADYGKNFLLTDQHGTPRSLADFRGKAVTLFFGYTQCPDVCPTNLSTMAEVMRLLGPDADRVQVLFVTVDPERDTQALLAQYLPAFDPRFLALRGDATQTADTAKEFRVFYRKSGDTDGPNYSVDHSTGTYIFDPAGRLRLYVKHGESAENIAADLRTLLAGK